MRQTERDRKRGGQSEEKRGTSQGGRVNEIEKGTIARKEKKKDKTREPGIEEEAARKKTENARGVTKEEDYNLMEG